MQKLIIVIERSPTIAFLLESYLRKDHHVIVCTTPQEVLSLFPTLAKTPDVIFLALDPQWQEEYQFITFLKRQRKYRETILIAMVGQQEQAQIERLPTGIPVRYLLKPFKIEEACALVWAAGPGVGAP